MLALRWVALLKSPILYGLILFDVCFVVVLNSEATFSLLIKGRKVEH